MAFFDTTWYTSSVGYAAVTARPQNTAVAAGVVRRQFTAPAVNSERVFVCIVAGTTANTTDATWTITRGAKTTDGTATWQECTGASAVNGDVTNTPNWTTAKAAGTPTLGAIIKRNNGASYQICTTAGAMGSSEPSFSDTAGVTTTDSSAVWTSLGVVGNFSAWGAPHARLANAFANTWGAAGNMFYVADNHAETQTTNMTLGSPATVVLPVYVHCVDRTVGVPPAVANFNTGATITTTGTASITVGSPSIGTNYYQGLAFNCGDGTSPAAVLSLSGSTNAANYIYKNCAFVLGNSSANSNIAVGINSASSNVYTKLDNCTMQFAATSQSLRVYTGYFEWVNTPSAIQGSTFPTPLFNTNAAGSSIYMVCRGVDFSAFSGQLVVNNSTNAAPFVFEDCKFHASMTRYGTSSFAGYSATPLITVRCDSGATNYKVTRDEYAGSQIAETSITRVGGATDGVTATSDKLVTNSQATFLTPLRMLPLAIWNETTGANVTVTVYGNVDGASLPTDGEIWMDVQYLGSSGSPLASFKTTAKAHPLATAANVSSDSSTWNNASNVSPAPLVFDATLSLGLTLSNGNRTALRTASATTAIAARPVTTRTTGKYYHEFTYVGAHGSSDSIGVVLSTGSASDMNNGQNSGVVFLNFGPGQIYSNNSNTGSLSTSFTAGDIIGVATDLDNRKIWFRKNAGNWNNSGTANPATNIGGLTLAASGAFGPAISLGNTGSVANDGFTMNCGQASYANAAPSGFGNWLDDGTYYAPFKLVATLTSPQPQMKGYIYANVKAAKPSTVYYIDPQVILS